MCCPTRWVKPSSLSPCPPALVIPKWFGRSGNNLVQLTGAVHVANATQAALVIPGHEVFGDGEGARVWDFRSPECVARQGHVVLANNTAAGFTFGRDAHPTTVSSIFFYRSECEAVGIDRLALSKRREVVTRLILPRLPPLARPTAAAAGEGTPPPRKQLVIHVRSGDVIWYAYSGRIKWYAPPPLAMFRKILIEGGYLDGGWQVLILHEDDLNPVVGALKTWLLAPPTASAVRFVSDSSLGDVVSTLTVATHLVTSVSTLSLHFGLLGAENLKRVYVPHCRQYLLMSILFDNGGYVSSFRNPLAGVNMTRRSRSAMRHLHDMRVAGGQADIHVPGFCYEFPGYDLEGKWTGTPAQVDKLTSYPEAAVVAHALPVG